MYYTCFVCKLQELLQAVTLLSCKLVQDVSDSNLGWDTDSSDRGFGWGSPVPLGKRWNNIVTCISDWDGFGLIFGFINRLQLVTTNNYNTVLDLHKLQSIHYNLLSLFPLVFTVRVLARDLNTGIITDSHFKYHCTKSLFITINTASPLLVTQLKHTN
jgi:hypothetical protein